MGLKYRDPKTGDYVHYNFPLIKGEKGEPGEPGSGIHVGEEAPTDPSVALWFKPSEGLNVTQDMITHKVDQNTGTFTPVWAYGSPTYVNQVGTYVKTGCLVNAFVEIEVNAWGEEGKDLVISGLPFSGTQGTPVTVDMVKGVKEASALDNPHIFGLISGNALKLYKRGMNGGWWQTAKTITDVHTHFIIRVAFTYRVAE